MTTPEPTVWHYVMALCGQIGTGAVHNHSHGSWTQSPGSTRADAFNEIYRSVCDRWHEMYGVDSDPNVLSFSLEPNELP